MIERYVLITDEWGGKLAQYKINVDGEGRIPTTEDLLQRALRMQRVGVWESTMKRSADDTGWFW